MRALAALAFAGALVGCKSFAYQCASSMECTQAGATGTCEPTGFCSFPDPSCESGRRYGEFAGGSYANACVGDAADAAISIDARNVDAFVPDAPPNAVTVSFGETGTATFAGVTIDVEIANGLTTNVNVDHNSVDLGDEWALWRFDISAIPTGATVVSAKIELETTGDGNVFSSGTAEVYRVLEAWEELAVTYLVRTSSASWTIAGAGPPNSRGATAIAQFAPTAEGRFNIALPASMVQDWVATPSSNNGVLVDTTDGVGHLHLCTREYPDPAKRALLVVTYVP